MAKFFSKKRSYSSRRKKAYSRIGRKVVRKSRRRRSWNRAMPNLKHSVMIPVHKRIALNFPNGSNAATIGIQRFKSATSSNVFSYGNQDGFTQRKNNWEQFAVMGVKTKFIPGNIRGTLKDLSLGNSLSVLTCSPIDQWTDPDTVASTGINVTTEVVFQKGDLKTFDPCKGFKQYFNNRPISKVQNLDWSDTAANVYFDQGTKSNAAIYYRYTANAPSPAQSNDTVVGYLDVTWYVRFRGIKGSADP